MTDFGVQWEDGDMLMRPCGDVHVVHLGAGDAEGYVTRWMRLGGAHATHMEGTREQVLREWGRLKGFCHRPSSAILRMVNYPGGE